MFQKLTFLITLLAFGLAGCVTQSGGPVQSLTLRARDIAFDVTAFDATVNQAIELTYINEGHIDHAFMIEGLLAEQKVAPGETRTFTFTPMQAGQFKFVCNIPGHEMVGMVGTFTVTEQEK